MKVSLKWLLQQSGLKGLRCIAGESLLNKKEIEGISVLDNPNATRWVKEGELVITSGYILKEQEKINTAIIKELIDAGCCGLGIKTKSYLQELPEELIALSKKNNFPLIDIPFYYSLSDIIDVVYSRFNTLENEKVNAKQKLMEDISDIFFSKRGVMEMTYRIAGFFNRTVLLLDEDFRCIYAAKKMSQKEICSKGDVLKRLKITDDHHDVFRFKNHHDVNVYNLLLPGEESKTTMLIVEEDSMLKQEDILLLNRCGKILAMGIEQAKKQRADKYFYDNIHYKEFYDYIAGFREYEGEELFELLRFINFQPQKRRILLLAEIHSEKLKTEELLQILETQVQKTKETMGMGMVVFSYNRKYMVYLFPSDSKTNLDFAYGAKKLADNIINFISPKEMKADIRIGISRCSEDEEGIARSYREAEKALDIGEKLQRNENVLVYNDLSIYDYFIQYPKCDEATFCNRILELREYDEKNNTELTITLLKFLESKFNMGDTASALYIHRNTLLKRIAKIRELLHCELDDMKELLPLCVEACAYDLFYKEGK